MKIKELVFVPYGKGLRSNCLCFVFLIEGKKDSFRWSCWDTRETGFIWNEEDSLEDCVRKCNFKWREILEPYVEEASELFM